MHRQLRLDQQRVRTICGSKHETLSASRKSARYGRAVLRGVAAGLSRCEIGARLHISLNTVEIHIRVQWRKLAGKSRADAVVRAEGLGLLELSESPG